MFNTSKESAPIMGKYPVKRAKIGRGLNADYSN